ncbi:MAG: methyl-accepting chemotaxis protein [Candidatus Dactylopiibacterium sp.]|nr:methyl-accepting chemotaxis protein [Candidatus Dactylopiibacterium sp.]
MKLSILHRLLLLGGVAIASLLIALVCGYFAAQAPRQGLERIHGEQMPAVDLFNGIERDFLDVRRLLAQHVIELYDEKKKTDADEILKLRLRIDDDIARYASTMASDAKERELLEQVGNLFIDFDRVSAEIMEKSTDYDTDTARELLAGSGSEIAGKIASALETNRQYKRSLTQGVVDAALAKSARIELLNAALGALAVALVVVLGALIGRSVRHSLREVQGTVEYIERNLDFTRRVRVSQGDELGTIAAAFNRLIERMHGTLREVSSSAEQLAGAAERVATDASRVAQAAATQSEAASSMAATVEEMTVSVNHVAERAQDASTLAGSSSHLAANGEIVIGQTVSDINDIAASVHQASERIHEFDGHGERIVSVVAMIKEVADQTNLLALNAAIEAARAGEQGRGFAVVADEVRKLAERTGASTQEISDSIERMRGSAGVAVGCMDDAVQRVAIGVSGAEETSQAIRQIREGSSGTVQRVEDIALSIREQGAATHAIAAQVEKIARLSEENSAVADESAGAARTLDALARTLNQSVSAYRL